MMTSSSKVNEFIKHPENFDGDPETHGIGMEESEVTHEVNSKPKRKRRPANNFTIGVTGIERCLFDWLVTEARVNERTLEGQVRYLIRKAYDRRMVLCPHGYALEQETCANCAEVRDNG